jgi:hypothetical protein
MLNIRISDIAWIGTNFTVTKEEHSAIFDGSQAYQLRNLWKTQNESIPISVISEQEIAVNIQRSDNAFMVAFLEFLVPIIAAYYLIGATLVLDSRNNLSERLRIYVSLFFFVPGYLIASQVVFPYRVSISFPELLLVNLLISATIFGVCSVIGKHRASINPTIDRLNKYKPERKWDAIAIALALSLLGIVYGVTFFGKITPQTSVFFSYVIIPAYVFWVPVLSIQTLSIKNFKKAIITILFGLFIAIDTYLLAFIFSDFWFPVLLVGGLLTGLNLGSNTSRKYEGAALGLVGGLIFTLVGGALVGAGAAAYIGTNVVDGCVNGLVLFGLLGYIYATGSIIGGYLGVVLRLKRRRPSKPLLIFDD